MHLPVGDVGAGTAAGDECITSRAPASGVSIRVRPGGVGIGVAPSAILSSRKIAGWITGLVIALVSVILWPFPATMQTLGCTTLRRADMTHGQMRV